MMLSPSALDREGRLVRLDADLDHALYVDEAGEPTGETRDLTDFERAVVNAQLEAEAQAAERGEAEATLTALRDNLQAAREILLAFGTPEGLPFAQTMSATQTALYDYRDSGLVDSECEEIKTWMTARSVEIIASAAYAAGLFGPDDN